MVVPTPPPRRKGDILRGLGVDILDELAYRRCDTFDQRGAFMLTKLKDHNAAKLADVLGDFYREAMPHSMEIARFEWQTILAFMGASDEQIRDVQLRIGGVWR